MEYFVLRHDEKVQGVFLTLEEGLSPGNLITLFKAHLFYIGPKTSSRPILCFPDSMNKIHFMSRKQRSKHEGARLKLKKHMKVFRTLDLRALLIGGIIKVKHTREAVRQGSRDGLLMTA
jgi:hypothetical protein